MGVGDEHREVDDSPSLVLHALEANLRRDSDQPVKIPLQVVVLRMAGYGAAEIRDRLALSMGEYKGAMGRLRQAVREPA